MMKNILLVLTQFFVIGVINGQDISEFNDKDLWVAVNQIEYESRLGNCEKVLVMFDSLNRNIKFKSAKAYMAVARCYLKNGNSKEADDLMIKGRSEGILYNPIKENEISHPKIRERFILMYIEDQGAWTKEGSIILDPDVQNEIEIGGVSHLFNQARQIEKRELRQLHIKEMEEIISANGFPNEKMIGRIALNGLKLVLIHAEIAIQLKYKEAFRKTFKKRSYAIFIDKIKVAQRKPQIYGTQGAFINNKLTFHPIEDEINVNIRRMSMGLKPLRMYAEELGIKNYKFIQK